MSLVVYLNSVNSTKFDQPMYTVIHMQDPGSVQVNQDHGSLASRVGSRVTSLPGRVGSRVNVADPVPSLIECKLSVTYKVVTTSQSEYKQSDFCLLYM